MKKSIILLLTILGIVTTSKAQYYELSTHAVGDTVEIVDSTTVQVLNMTIGDMNIESAKSCKVINVFRLQEYADDDTKLIPSFIGTKIHFQATDDQWNYLDLNIYVDLQANFHAIHLTRVTIQFYLHHTANFYSRIEAHLQKSERSMSRKQPLKK